MKFSLLNNIMDIIDKRGEPYICVICGKTVKKWNKTQHESQKYHKLLEFCKIKINDAINEVQLNSSPNIYDGEKKNKPKGKKIIEW